MDAADEAQVRNDVKPTRVYLEYEIRDSVDRPIVQEIDVPPPALLNNASVYSIWSVGLTGTQAFNSFAVGAEVDGIKATRNSEQQIFSFSACV